MADKDKDDAVDLAKTEQLNIRMSALQMQRLEEAAGVVSRERGELVDLGTLARELIVEGTETIRGRKASAA